jgi:hypothetical protein
VCGFVKKIEACLAFECNSNLYLQYIYIFAIATFGGSLGNAV